jgi:ParB family chromosome partitioning protein
MHTEPAAAGDRGASAIRGIPLHLLQISPANVRKTKPAQLEQLVASIEAHGLLQSLVVIADGDRFSVVAGGRRLQALQALLAAGKRSPDDLVNCVVHAGDNAAEISLAENVVREAMHPADQFEAFRALIKQGEGEADVAARFGVTVPVVRQRLKLANVAPEILAAYRLGKLNLEAVEAYALSDDHPRQLRALKQGAIHPHYIRDLLTKGEIPSTDKRVRFVGLEAIEARGCAVRRDMFEPLAGYVADVALLDRMVAEKIEETVGKLRAEGFAWVDHGPGVEAYRYPRVAGKLDKGKCGAVVTIAHNGRLEIERGVLKPGSRSASSSSAKPKKAKKPGALAFSQLQLLQVQRTAAIAGALSTNPRVALAALAANLAEESLKHKHAEVDGLVLIHTEKDFGLPSTSRVDEALAATPQIRTLDKAIAEIRKQLPAGGSVFAWLLTQPEAFTHQLLALCVAREFNAIEQFDRNRDHGGKFADIIGLNMADHWTVSGEWLAQQPSAYLTHVVGEACGKTAAAELAKCKGKQALVAKAAQLLAGVPRWLPAPLRSAIAAKPKTAAKPARAAKKAAKPKAKPTPKKPAKKAAKPAKRGAK